MKRTNCLQSKMSEGRASGRVTSGETGRGFTSQPVIERSTENATLRPRVWISESGVTPPRLEGILSESKVKTFLKEYADYKQDVERESGDGIARRACGILEVSTRAARNSVSLIFFEGEELSEERMLEGLMKLARVQESEIQNPRRVEADFKRILTMDPSLPIVDRVTEVLCKLEDYVIESCLERFKPQGKWDESVGRVVGEFMVKGIRPNAFQQRVRSELRFKRNSERPEVIKQAMLKAALEVRDEEFHRRLDEGLGRAEKPGRRKAQ